MNQQTIPLSLRWLDPEQDADLPLPRYHSELAAGMDVAAAVRQPLADRKSVV